jgi:hypothetical protein
MEARAPYHTAPKPPRNLAEPVAQWLREQGFTATEQQHETMVTVEAHWIGPVGDRYELTYTWVTGPVPDATCQMQVTWLGFSLKLFGAQRVRRLKEVHLLLLGNVRYANARMLATIPHPAL